MTGLMLAGSTLTRILFRGIVNMRLCNQPFQMRQRLKERIIFIPFAIVTLFMTAGLATTPALAEVESSDSIENVKAPKMTPGPLTDGQRKFVCPTRGSVNPMCTDFVGVGQSGEHIKHIQRAINASGQKVKLAIDGQFGPKTEAALTKVQEARGLAVDGVVGRQTLSTFVCASSNPNENNAEGWEYGDRQCTPK